VVISLAKPALFHTQRNNKIDPAETCNVTAMINALLATGIDVPAPEGVQPEDHLAWLLSGEAVKKKLAAEYPDLAGRKPREVHAILSWAVNTLLLGRPVTTFSLSVDFREILFRILRNRAASVMTGKFTPGGHLVAVVGLETDQDDIEAVPSPGGIDLKMIRKVLVHDSWGDWHGGYRDSQSGYEVPFTFREFWNLTREYDSARKWAHLFDRDGRF